MDISKAAADFIIAISPVAGSNPQVTGVGFTWNLRGGVQSTPDEHVTIHEDGTVTAEFDGDVFEHASMEAYTASVVLQLTEDEPQYRTQLEADGKWSVYEGEGLRKHGFSDEQSALAFVQDILQSD